MKCCFSKSPEPIIPVMAVFYTLISESVQKALHNRRLDGLE